MRSVRVLFYSLQRHMEMTFYFAVAIFIASFLAIVLDLFPKSLVAMSGALLMVLTGVMTFEDATLAVDLETIGLLMGMMLMVDIVSDSGVFSWMSVKIAKLTGGKPWLIFLLFALITALGSTFLNNVTIILIVLPIVLALTKGVGLNVKPFVLATIIYSIVGGTLTLIGDPTNVIIGTSVGLSFNDFLANMWIPILSISVVVFAIFIFFNWASLRPISGNLKQLFISHLLIQKIEYKFGRQELSKPFIIRVLAVLLAVILGFIFGDFVGINASVVALVGAMGLFFITTRHSSIYSSLAKVEWPTLLFFTGLFVMVAGLRKVGALEMIGDQFIAMTQGYSFLAILLILLWVSGIASMIIDNVPFVTMMIPIVLQIQGSLGTGVPVDQLWWAMALGACLGGCGSPIGSSANVVALGLAEKSGYHISNKAYLKTALPITLVMLAVSSLYFVIIL